MNETEAKLPIYMRQSNNYCLKFAIELWESKIECVCDRISILMYYAIKW